MITLIKFFLKYFNFQGVFFEAKANILFKLDSNDFFINTQNKEFSFDKIYNLSQFELKMLKKYIIEQLNQKFIIFFKFLADALVLFFVKKNESFHLCVDYKKLNVIIIKNQHALLLIQKTMNRLIATKKFIKLNIRCVYNMIRIKKTMKKKVFKINYKHLKYKIISFELINAFSTFQHYINKIFADHLNIFVFIYLNDIFIYSVNDEMHTKHVRMVLLKLRQYSLYCKINKCCFQIIWMNDLKLIINEKNVVMKHTKIIIIKNWSIFMNFHDIHISWNLSIFKNDSLRFTQKSPLILSHCWRI